MQVVIDRLESLPDGLGYVGSDLAVVHRGLGHVRSEALAAGTVFCDWGSGHGGVCAVAALNGFRPNGIEIQAPLVASARRLAAEMDLPMRFAEGTYLLPGDESLVATTANTRLSFDALAWEELDVGPGDCDIVFSYPWPGEESSVEEVFSRHASPGALLMTFHGHDYLLLQRKREADLELEQIGWL